MTGIFNTEMGNEALFNNTFGNDNIAIGDSALDVNSSGSGNIAIGVAAGGNLATGDNNINIGNLGVAAEADTIRVGTEGTQTATFVAGISGTPVVGGVAVEVDSNGQLGVSPSSVRFKKEIRPMDRVSEAILALKPVSFQYKRDSKGTPQFG